MASERQIAANRRNAQKSTGPKTQAGKKKSSENSYRHGLSLPISKVASRAQFEELSRQFARAASDAESLAQAERAADAQLELMRVRKAQTAIIERALKLSTSDAAFDRLNSVAVASHFSQTDQPGTMRGESPPQPGISPLALISLPGGNEEEDRRTEVGQILLDLTRISRYEKRAAGRRDGALGKIKNLTQDGS